MVQKDELQNTLQAAGDVIQRSVAWRWRLVHKWSVDHSSCERVEGRTRLTLAVGYPALSQIVWSHLNAHLVTGQNTDVVFTHLS